MPVLKNLAWVETNFDPRLSQTFKDLSNAQDNAANVTGVSGVATKAPPNVRSIFVQAAHGFFNVAITDPEGQGGQSQGIFYFLDWDTSPNFTNPQTIHLGPARNWYGALGSQTTYWRAYSQFLSSPRSDYVYFGGQAAPTGVPGGGAAGPVPAASQGSGGKGGRGGFGGT
jgi:hypothetical protein